MHNVIETLRERGFVENTTHDRELEDCFSSGMQTCYIGFDPTASSLHIGSLVPIMSLAHMQRCGHRPIGLVGGGTGLVGDPSGKTEMRKLLTYEQVEENARGIRRQLARFIDFEDGRALMLNNAEWLTKLGYIPFLRDYGRYFSVNRMIKAESYRLRLDSEEGLSFVEFNYMLLQAYDFFHLSKHHDCRLQMGGSDQWGNIVAGIELVRRTCREQVFGMTFPLITTSSGAKMGKTAQGAVWLDAERTSPYDYYQYWVNTDDRDVARFLALFTFLPMDQIRKVEQLAGAELNGAKTILAYEAAALAHGEEEARRAYEAAVSVFGGRRVTASLLPDSRFHAVCRTDSEDSVPHTVMSAGDFTGGIPAFKLFQRVGLAATGGASRRLIQQGGAYVNGERVVDIDQMITDQDVHGTEIVLRSGKKHFHKILIKN